MGFIAQSEIPRVAETNPTYRRRNHRNLHDEGVQRYGFHGISYEYVLSELDDAARGRVIIAPLGTGSSIAVVRGGSPIDTTMSMTPAGGLMMATRSGDLDPGVLIHLMYEKGYDPAAREAIDLFCYTARKHIGSMAGALQGLDTLVFTAGIGERSPKIRSRICDGLAHLGVELDQRRNEHSKRVISSTNNTCAVRVISTQEELLVALHTVRLISGPQQPIVFKTNLNAKTDRG